VEHFRLNGMVVLGLGEIHVGSVGTDTVTPKGAALPSWRVSGVPVPNPLCAPGETLGLVRIAAASMSFSLLKVMFGMRRFGVLGAW
jgi:hypothetical protein